jgi:CheY-like chemotaxis protein/anti-sigma regulatory factor (Ser/Thr protein kinase)
LLDLNSALETAVEGVRSTAEAKGVRVECAGEAAQAMVLADGARIQQVLWNLLSNAIKFTPKGGNVRAEVHNDGHQVRVVISDSGRGIEPEFLPHIFDRFRQGESGSARAAGGLGLGLSIVKHLVEMHGGSVSAYSSGKGEGATFSVALPATSLVPDTEQAATLSVQSSFASDHSLSGLRVLVVEDDDDARILVGRVLGEAGAEALECADVDTALARLDEFAPQVLVSDIGMSPRDGYELIRKIRSSGLGAAQLPAVALTAFARMEDRRSVLLAGYQMHLAKPADPQELVAAVASLAGRTGSRTR